MMGDEMYCPDCKDGLQLPGQCVCGWRLVNRKSNLERCFHAFHSDGEVCKQTPVIFENKRGWCREHWREKSKVIKPKPEVVAAHMDKIYASLGKIHLARKRTERLVA